MNTATQTAIANKCCWQYADGSIDLIGKWQGKLYTMTVEKHDGTLTVTSAKWL